MNVTFRCPSCERTVRSDNINARVACSACGTQIEPTPGSVQEGRLRGCLVCPSRDLFVRKDFPQHWGVAIIVVGFLLSSVAWAYYQSVLSLAILLVSAAADALLYLFVGNVVACYRCHAEYRGLENIDEYAQFDLAVHERYRQQAARMKEAQRLVAAGSASSENDR